MMSLILEKHLQNLMEKHSIPYEQAAGMITSAKLEEMVIVTEEIRKYSNDGDRDGRGRTTNHHELSL